MPLHRIKKLLDFVLDCKYKTKYYIRNMMNMIHNPHDL